MWQHFAHKWYNGAFQKWHYFSVQSSKATSSLKVVFFAFHCCHYYYYFKGGGRDIWGSYNNNAAFLGYPVKGAYQNVVRRDGLKALKEWNWRV